ncbi:MAG: hypothetical protein K9N07_10200 [Candidatus Cloacimonetes bacterium]|nr:hypothetical protein [Candidatus Cloacimonadota bacterium]
MNSSKSTFLVIFGVLFLLMIYPVHARIIQCTGYGESEKEAINDAISQAKLVFAFFIETRVQYEIYSQKGEDNGKIYDKFSKCTQLSSNNIRIFGLVYKQDFEIKYLTDKKKYRAENRFEIPDEKLDKAIKGREIQYEEANKKIDELVEQYEIETDQSQKLDLLKKIRHILYSNLIFHYQYSIEYVDKEIWNISPIFWANIAQDVTYDEQEGFEVYSDDHEMVCKVSKNYVLDKIQVLAVHKEKTILLHPNSSNNSVVIDLDKLKMIMKTDTETKLLFCYSKEDLCINGYEMYYQFKYWKNTELFFESLQRHLNSNVDFIETVELNRNRIKIIKEYQNEEGYLTIEPNSELSWIERVIENIFMIGIKPNWHKEIAKKMLEAKKIGNFTILVKEGNYIINQTILIDKGISLIACGDYIEDTFFTTNNRLESFIKVSGCKGKCTISNICFDSKGYDMTFIQIESSPADIHIENCRFKSTYKLYEPVIKIPKNKRVTIENCQVMIGDDETTHNIIRNHKDGFYYME